MEKRMEFDYYFGAQSDQFSFIRIPRLMLTDAMFSALSIPAKLLYGVLLDRMSLSRRNNWIDDENRVYIIYQVGEIQDDLGFTKKKALELLSELEDFGLLEKKRRGRGLPNVLYLKSFMTGSGVAATSEAAEINSKYDGPDNQKADHNNYEAESGSTAAEAVSHNNQEARVAVAGTSGRNIKGSRSDGIGTSAVNTAGSRSTEMGTSGYNAGKSRSAETGTSGCNTGNSRGAEICPSGMTPDSSRDPVIGFSGSNAAANLADNAPFKPERTVSQAANGTAAKLSAPHTPSCQAQDRLPEAVPPVCPEVPKTAPLEVPKTELLEVPKSAPLMNYTYKNKTYMNHILSDLIGSVGVGPVQSDFDPIRSDADPIRPDVDPAAKSDSALEAVKAYEELIRDNICYPDLLAAHPHDKELIDGIVGLILETVLFPGDYFLIARNKYPAAVVKSRFMKLGHSHIEYVLFCLQRNTTKVGNIKKYLLAMLFNAPSTKDSYYQAEVNHDLYGEDAV